LLLSPAQSVAFGGSLDAVRDWLRDHLGTGRPVRLAARFHYSLMRGTQFPTKAAYRPISTLRIDEKVGGEIAVWKCGRTRFPAHYWESFQRRLCRVSKNCSTERILTPSQYVESPQTLLVTTV